MSEEMKKVPFKCRCLMCEARMVAVRDGSNVTIICGKCGTKYEIIRNGNETYFQLVSMKDERSAV